MEQYLEIIYDLQEKWGAASVTDIAQLKKVKSPSVTYVLQKLKELGLINYKKYRSVTLTPKGRRIAKKLQKTHETLRWFLVSIGVDETTADDDACELEHLVQSETAERLSEFVEWMKNNPDGLKWLDKYRKSTKKS
jgi:DtxR family Mn-dependent transcriptional regulator